MKWEKEGRGKAGAVDDELKVGGGRKVSGRVSTSIIHPKVHLRETSGSALVLSVCACVCARLHTCKCVYLCVSGSSVLKTSSLSLGLSLVPATSKKKFFFWYITMWDTNIQILYTYLCSS